MIDSNLADVRRRTRAAQHVVSYPLLVMGVLFTATQLTLLDPFVRWLGFFRLQGVWVVIVGAGLVALGFARHERTLATWGIAVGVVGLAVAIIDPSHWTTILSNGDVIEHGPQSAPVAVLGAVLTIVGLLTYERERRVA